MLQHIISIFYGENVLVYAPFHSIISSKSHSNDRLFVSQNQRILNGKLIDYCIGIDMNAMPKMRFVCLLVFIKLWFCFNVFVHKSMILLLLLLLLVHKFVALHIHSINVAEKLMNEQRKIRLRKFGENSGK